MQLKKGDKQEKTLYTGLYTGPVLAINPSKEELSSLLGYELTDKSEDIKYSGEDKNGKDYVEIVFWQQAQTPEKQFFANRFRITDKPQTNKDETKRQFVNQSGMSSWIDEEKNLQSWFTKFIDKDKNVLGDKQVRVALQGEANLYNFLRAWIAKADYFSQDTNLLIDTKKLFRNVDKFVEDEYRSLLKADSEDKMIGSPGAFATVYTAEKDGETKLYQNIYSEYIPEWQVKKFSLAISSGNWDADKGVKKFKEQYTSEYHKDAYTLGFLEKFDPATHLQSSNETFIDNSGGADDTDY